VRALAAALTISAAMALTGNQAHPAEAAPAAGDEATAPLPTVTVRQLYDEFHRDFAAAQQKYQGKKLRVTGKIRSINPTIAGEPGFLNLTATGYDTFVECAISEADKPRLLPLNRGQKLSAIGQEPTVTVVGTVSRIFGGSLTGYVLLQPVTLPPLP